MSTDKKQADDFPSKEEYDQTGSYSEEMEPEEYQEFESKMAKEKRDAFDPKQWMANLEHKRQMDSFVPGTYDPGSSIVNELQKYQAGLFISDGKDEAYVNVDKNPNEYGSFGFVGDVVYVKSESSFLVGTLVLPFDSKQLGGVDRGSLRLFYWDDQMESFRLVPHSGVGSKDDYVWGRISKPGRYTIIGLHSHPLVIRTILVTTALGDLMSTLKPELQKKIHDKICNLLLGDDEVREAINDPQVLDRLILTSLAQDLPDPQQVWKPNPGFEGYDLPDRCPPWLLGGWPEVELLPLEPRPLPQVVQLSSPVTPLSQFSSTWRSVGPIDLAGCILQVVVDPTNNNRLYAAAEDGGLWRLDNVSAYPRAMWRPLTDQNASLKIRAVAVAPGTGRVYIADGLNQFLRSDTRGATWQMPSRINLGLVHRILVHPMDANLVYVASATGLWRSRNGGETWGDTGDTPAQNPIYRGDVLDIGMDPGDPSILFIGDRGQGVFRSTTGGNTWVPQAILPWSSASSPSGTMIKIAVGRQGADANNRTVVVRFDQQIFINQNGGLPQTVPNGGPWRSLGMGGGNNQGDFCNAVAVDPFDNNVILTGGFTLVRTSNALSANPSWATVIAFENPLLHEDQHWVEFDRTQQNVVYVANDGGVFRSMDGGATWTELNYGLVTAQFYRVGVSQQRALGNLYHSGIGTTDLRTRNWTGSEGHGREWSYVYADPKRPSTFYIFWQQSVLGRQRFPGPERADISTFIPYTSGSSTSTPVGAIAVDTRATSNTMLVGTSNPGRVMRTLDVTVNSPAWAAVPGISLPNDPIAAIAFAPSSPGLAYAASENGQVFRKEEVNTEGNWDLRGNWSASGIKQLAVNSQNSARLYLINGAQAVRSENGGQSWNPIQGTGSNMLPSSEFNSIVASPSGATTLFLAADIGVFVTYDEGANWYPFDDDLPNAQVLQIFVNGPYLYAVTYGRGLWRRSL